MTTDLLKPSRWMVGEGPKDAIVISSRIRLARNLQGLPFPQLLTTEKALEVISLVKGAITSSQVKEQLGDTEFISIEELELLDRQILVEKHVISPQLAEDSIAKAVVLGLEETISIMINEEDHLRIQCILPAFQIDEAWTIASAVDDALEKELDYAFQERFGYLTSCPTNVGTGLRASVMLHLPGLVLTKQAGNILSALSKVGLTVRGLYGEGSDAVGHIFQVSNQITLGQTEGEIISNLKAVCTQIIEQEQEARQVLARDWGMQLEDRIGRSLGILTHCKMISSEEAVKLLSDLRIGIGMGYISEISIPVLNQLLVFMQPAILQKLYGGNLAPQERDLKRAELIKSKLLKQCTRRD